MTEQSRITTETAVDRILRDSGLPIETLDDGTVLPDMSATLDDLDFYAEDTRENVILRRAESGWINMHWGDHPVGGAWVGGDKIEGYRHSEHVSNEDLPGTLRTLLPAIDAIAEEDEQETMIEELDDRLTRAGAREARRLLEAEARHLLEADA